ncbi:hypothetical protein [Sneathiella limimaris]|uniref:hypothetical protein n=1 Tax=Sneathiella limimaris TaxID=1964213 RepID=UPI00146C32DB|nr:hypothetical protein [Sneathiella limimaris]
MVKISGTVAGGVQMSGRMFGQNFSAAEQQVRPVEKVDKPVIINDQRPDMTFSGIGRTIDISV